MSRQSEAERLASAVQADTPIDGRTRPFDIDHRTLAKAYLALQAQVEQAEGGAQWQYEKGKEWRLRALEAEKREAALQEAMRLIAVKYGNESNLRAWVPAKAILDALTDRAPSEQSESDEWSKGEHLAEARTVEEHQECKHRERGE